jgi:hypothetical protein
MMQQKMTPYSIFLRARQMLAAISSLNLEPSTSLSVVGLELVQDVVVCKSF